MAHFVRIIKAWSLKKKWNEYLTEKEISYEENESDNELSEESEFEEEICRWWFMSKTNFPDSVGNLLLKSVIGFVGGVLLMYLFFFFFYIGLSFSLKTTTSLCALAGIILCLGLAFSSMIRCYVLLFLPVFFSKEGRQVLLTYALFLAFTGPGGNSMHNIGVLSDSLICGQDMVRKTLKQIYDMVKAPFRSSKETIEKIIKTLMEVIQSFKQYVLKMERLIICIIQVIKNASTWLRSITTLCNNKIGTPFQRCMKTFDDALIDCKARLGVIDFVCHVVHVVRGLCYSVKCVDFVCLYTEFFSDQVLAVTKKRLSEFNRRMNELFYVSVEFCDRFKLENAANTTKKVSTSTLQKIARKVEQLQSLFSFFGFTFCLLFLFFFFKVYWYKYKFLTSDQYDNVYISQYIVDLDIRRALMDRETVLPLEPRERRMYGKPTAIRLLEIEKTRIAQSMSFLSLTSFKILTFLVFDYSLFWVLLTMYRAGYDVLTDVEKSKFVIHVDGRGVLPNFYRDLGKAFQVPENANLHLTPIHCLPDPVQPDTGRYMQIGFLVVICWFLTLTEGYGMRLRNVVMSHYYPDRARERAIWLYNHILCSRGSFLRYARRQLRRKYSGRFGQMERASLTRGLFANFPLLRGLFGRNEQNRCLICGQAETKTAHLRRCNTPDCQGRYCLQCFATLLNVCTICQNPVEYGDISDVSEEIDSSEEEVGNRNHRQYYEGEESNENFLTFKEMELRDRFWDVESNKVPDYAELGDLYHDEKALKRRLKAVLQRHIQKAKKRTNRGSIKESMYKLIRLKLENLISKLKRKKSREITLKKLAGKIASLRTLRRKKRDEAEEAPPEKSAKRSKSKVSFKLEPDVQEVKEVDYKMLKKKIKAKIKWLKENKSLGPTTAMSRDSSWKSEKGDDKSRDDSSNETSQNHYFVQKEKDFGFSGGEQRRSASEGFLGKPKFERKTDFL